MTRRMKQIVKDLQEGAILICVSDSNKVGLWKSKTHFYEFSSMLLYRMEVLGIIYQEPRRFDYILTEKYRK